MKKGKSNNFSFSVFILFSVLAYEKFLFITVSVMSILICLISGALYAYCKDINIHNYSLDKINSNNVEIININKEIAKK